MAPRTGRGPSRAERMGVKLDTVSADALDRQTVLGSRHPVLKTRCMEWQGSLCGGYGRLTIGGVGVYTHRLSVALMNQRWPRDQVRHLCHNTKCVNPFHLREGSPKDNARDMVLAGRSNRQPGVPSRIRKLSDDDVAELRRLLALPSMARPRELKTQRKMAAHFGIHESVITGIKNGTRYRAPASVLPPKPAPARSRRKLTPRQAAEVKALSRAPRDKRPEGLRLIREITAHYGISKSLVGRIRQGRLHDQVEPAALDSIQAGTHSTAGEGQ